MSIKRKDFLRSAGTLTIGRLTGLKSVKQSSGNDEGACIGIGRARRKIRVAYFDDHTFPTRDARSVTKAFLDDILEPFERKPFTVATASTVLRCDTVELFFHPFGSAFPEELLPELRRYLSDGGNWMQLGGIPLSMPAASAEGRWILPEQRGTMPSWLPFLEPVEISGRQIRKWQLANSVIRAITPPVLKKGTLWNLVLREDSAPHVREKSLLSGMDRDGAKNARPIQQLDWIDGQYEGGRWIIGSCSSFFPPEEIHPLIKLAAFGPVQLDVELVALQRRKAVQATLYHPNGSVAQYLPAKAMVRMWNESSSQTAYLADAFMSMKGDRATAVFPVPSHIDLTNPATAEVSFELDRTPLGHLKSRIILKS